MDINKATFSTEGPNLRLSLPITKFDKERRTVSGFATMDNLDSHGDVLTKEASVKAFTEFRGNLREMHAPKAVGKVLSFEERDYVDPKTGDVHNGIWVEVYVSKGAQDTWEKVLDGTLTGFSIGGAIVDATEKFDKSSNSVQRWVEEYRLTELSLVDNPANQLCNVFSIQKSADGTVTMTGMAMDVETQNVFLCENGGSDTHAIIVSKRETVDCSDCSKPMKNIGWVEANDTTKSQAIADLVKMNTSQVDTIETTLGAGEYIINSNGTASFASGHLSKYNATTNGNYYVTINTTTNPATLTDAIVKAAGQNTKGGVDVPEETKPEENAVTETTDEGAVVDNVETRPSEEEAAAPAEAQETADNSEVEPENDLQKMFTGFATEIKAAFEKNREETTAEVATLKKSLEETTAALETKVSELTEKFGSLETKVGATEKRIDGVEGETAIRKSADLGRDDDKITKNSDGWGGAFLAVDEL